MGIKDDDQIRFCTPDERKEYFQMKEQIETNGKVNNQNMNDILMNIMKHRVPFDNLVSTWVIFLEWMKSDYVIPCGCLISNIRRIYCKYKPDKFSKKYRNVKLYENGMNRFYQEIDIVHLLKSVRLFRLYISSMTDQK